MIPKASEIRISIRAVAIGFMTPAIVTHCVKFQMDRRTLNKMNEIYFCAFSQIKSAKTKKKTHLPWKKRFIYKKQVKIQWDDRNLSIVCNMFSQCCVLLNLTSYAPIGRNSWALIIKLRVNKKC